MADLDIGACQFAAKLNTEGRDSEYTKFRRGFGGTLVGHLAYEEDDLENLKALGLPAILVVDDNSNGLIRSKKDEIAGLIICRPFKGRIQYERATGASAGTNIYPLNHILPELAERGVVTLMGDFSNPNARVIKEGGAYKLEFSTQQGDFKLANDVVSIDSRGPLYPEELEQLETPEYMQDIIQIGRDLVKESGVKIYVNSESKFFARRGRDLGADGVGLIRTEKRTQSMIELGVGELLGSDDSLANKAHAKEVFWKLLGEEVFEASHLNPDASGDNISLLKILYTCSGNASGYFLNDNGQEIPTTVRLVDLAGIKEDLPSRLTQTTEFAKQHEVGSELFQIRQSLYSIQAVTALKNYGALYTNKDVLDYQGRQPKIMIPAIETAEELNAIKDRIAEDTSKVDLSRPEGEKPYKFGAMIETKAALNDIDAIARSVDFISFGTNDLTAELLGLSRDEMDHSQWMKDYGYDDLGDNPFEVLVPPVIEQMHSAIQIARLANSDIEINICGHQIAGHDQRSIEAVFDMGIDGISIPPSKAGINRATTILAKQYSKAHIAELELNDVG